VIGSIGKFRERYRKQHQAFLAINLHSTVQEFAIVPRALLRRASSLINRALAV